MKDYTTDDDIPLNPIDRLNHSLQKLHKPITDSIF